MKKKSFRILIVLSLLALVLGGVFAFAAERNYPTEPAGFDISNNPLMIAAPRMVKAKDWVAGTRYSHGDMVRDTNRKNRVYWNVSNHTNKYLTTGNPTHLKDDAADGTTNAWRRIPPQHRMGIYVHNSGLAYVWLAIGYTAVANAGIVLAPGGDFFVDGDTLQDYVSAISTNVAVTNLVTTQEM